MPGNFANTERIAVVDASNRVRADGLQKAGGRCEKSADCENNFMKQLNLFSILLLILAAGCGAATGRNHIGAAPDRQNLRSPTASSGRSPPTSNSATIQHDADSRLHVRDDNGFYITVKSTNELNGIAPNDEINFQLVVRDDDGWIKNIRFVSPSD